MSNTIGPCLPPHLQKGEKDENNAATNAIGPALPPRDTTARSETPDAIGPALPPWLKRGAEPTGDDEKQAPVAIGPVLPARTKSNEGAVATEEDSYGPALPPGLQRKRTIGPALPSEYQRPPVVDDDDDDIIGPLPPPSGVVSNNTVAEEFERRSKKMKDRLTGNEKKKLEREEWMTELPPLLQGFGGVGARKFRVREKNEIGDRSVWTDTPADKAKRAAMGPAAKLMNDDERMSAEITARRDAEIASKLESNRGESLMLIHEKERKRKLEEDVESGEANIRRPFDRDLDLQANRFDDAAKKRMIKKTQGLSNRFSHGASTAKFL